MDRQLYGDIGAGIHWQYGKSVKKARDIRKMEATCGVAVHHAVRFALARGTYFTYTVDRRYTACAEGSMDLGKSYFALQPALWYHRQGPWQQALAGTMLRYTIDDASAFMSTGDPKAVAGGIFMRPGDAVVVRGVREWGSYLLGAAYDIAQGGVSSTAPRRSAIELMVVWRKS
jgi:hypothetical protein